MDNTVIHLPDRTWCGPAKESHEPGFLDADGQTIFLDFDGAVEDPSSMDSSSAIFDTKSPVPELIKELGVFFTAVVLIALPAALVVLLHYSQGYFLDTLQAVASTAPQKVWSVIRPYDAAPKSKDSSPSQPIRPRGSTRPAGDSAATRGNSCLSGVGPGSSEFWPYQRAAAANMLAEDPSYDSNSKKSGTGSTASVAASKGLEAVATRIGSGVRPGSDSGTQPPSHDRARGLRPGESRDQFDASNSSEKAQDELQTAESQLKSCELALELMEKGRSVFSGFLPEQNGTGVESMKIFQSKIAELEIKRRSLATRFMPQSKDMRAINEEIAVVKDTMKECLTEHISYLKRRKEYLAGKKREVEPAKSSVVGSSRRLKMSPFDMGVPESSPRANPGIQPRSEQTGESKRPLAAVVTEAAAGLLCSARTVADRAVAEAKDCLRGIILCWDISAQQSMNTD